MVFNGQRMLCRFQYLTSRSQTNSNSGGRGQGSVQAQYTMNVCVWVSKKRMVDSIVNVGYMFQLKWCIRFRIRGV